MKNNDHSLNGSNPDMPASFVETTFHVRYAETDQMGIVHHSAFPESQIVSLSANKLYPCCQGLYTALASTFHGVAE